MRDALEGAKAVAAQKLLERAARKREREKAAPAPEAAVTPAVLPAAPAIVSGVTSPRFASCRLLVASGTIWSYQHPASHGPSP